MPEAEVSLRLAFHLLQHKESDGEASAAIDGAQVRVGQREIFPIEQFLAEHGWTQESQSGRNTWQGSYRRDGRHLIERGQPGGR